MIEGLFRDRLEVVNVGLDVFAESIRVAGGAVQRTDWRPPAAGNRKAGAALASLVNLAAVEQANDRAFAAYLKAQPVLARIGRQGPTFPEWASA